MNYFDPRVLSKISRLELRAQRVVDGFVSGLHKSPYKGFSVEFADYRSYVPGDDVRHLDWRAYAKTDRLVIKEYEVETNLRTHILLDCSASMAYAGEAPKGAPARLSKWDYAATLAVSIAHLLVRQQDGVGMFVFDESVRRHCPVSSKRAQLRELVSAIEDNTPQGGTAVRSLLGEVADRVPSRGMVVLISDLLCDVDEVFDGLRRLKFGQHDVVVMHVLDHDELEFPFDDRTLFEGMETPVEVLTDPQSLRRDYQRAVQDFVVGLRGGCLNHGIDYNLISTGDPVDVAMVSFLARRMHRRRRTA